MKRSRTRALSLTEAVFSIFLLAAGGLGLLSLFQSGIRASGIAQKRQLATLLAEQRLAEIRSAFRNVDNFLASGGYPNSPAIGFEDYRITVEIGNQKLDSPCTGFQVDEPRLLKSSYRKVAVTVSHPPYGAGDRVRLLSYIGEPVRQLDSISVRVVGGVPDPVPPEAGATYRVEARDSAGRALEDLFYRWSIATGTSNASVRVEDGSDTQRARFTNRIELAGEVIHRTGTCRVRAVARYRGVVDHGDSGPLNLQGDP